MKKVSETKHTKISKDKYHALPAMPKQHFYLSKFSYLPGNQHVAPCTFPGIDFRYKDSQSNTSYLCGKPDQHILNKVIITKHKQHPNVSNQYFFNERANKTILLRMLEI